jgi:hypothetical protein
MKLQILMCICVHAQKYGVAEKPKGRLQDKIDVAVDAVVQMTLGERTTLLTTALASCSGSLR